MNSNNNDPRFVEYYEEASASVEAAQRAKRLMETILRARSEAGLPIQNLVVADIGCNTGTQSHCWLEDGHRVRGVDISESLIGIARKRNQQFGDHAEYSVGTATKLLWSDAQFDVVLLPELLEHVDDWRACLSEAVRVMKSGGSLFLSTTNRLCPVQQEFDLPLYSWYPTSLKNHFVKVATTTQPRLVNFTSFPAIHWFSPYQLKAHLRALGVITQDRFDLIDVRNKPLPVKALVATLRSIAPLRFFAHVLTPYTFIVGCKN